MDKNECDYLYSESETEEHLNGKRDLFEWLKRQDGVTNAVLEGWLPLTKQRPDILFEYNGKTCVIEYQCTPIASEYIERHELYRAAGIKDIWIAGTEKYFKPNARRKFIESHIDGYYNSAKKQYIPGSNTKQGKFMQYIDINNKPFSLNAFIFNNFTVTHRTYIDKDFEYLRSLHIQRRECPKKQIKYNVEKRLDLALKYIPKIPYCYSIYNQDRKDYIRKKCVNRKGFYKNLFDLKQNIVKASKLNKIFSGYKSNKWVFYTTAQNDGILVSCYLFDYFRNYITIQHDDVDIRNKKQIEEGLLLPLMKLCKEEGLIGNSYVRVMEVRD